MILENTDIIENIKKEFKEINLNIFVDFCKFINDFRSIRYKIKSEKEKRIEEMLIKEKEKVIIEITEDNLSDVNLSVKKRLQTLRKQDSTENSNNTDNDYIKHKRSNILLSDLNEKIGKQALLDSIISNSNITLKEVVFNEKPKSIFKESKIRPPKK